MRARARVGVAVLQALSKDATLATNGWSEEHDVEEIELAGEECDTIFWYGRKVGDVGATLASIGEVLGVKVSVVTENARGASWGRWVESGQGELDDKAAKHLFVRGVIEPGRTERFL